MITDYDDETRHAVAVVVVENDQFLVIRRSQHVRAPGKACFPGGHIESGETEPCAVEREMLEELSIACEPQRVVWRSRTSWGTNVAWWLARRTDDRPPKADPAEVEEVMWLSAQEMLAHPDLLESNQHFLELLDRGEIELG
jgi:8-oxo-dGTP diphosphatase